MVIIFNKSNRPIGIAGLSVLPDKEIKIRDKDAYCSVFDENGNDTGKKQLLPGIVALKNMNFVTIREEEEVKPVEKVEVKKDAPETEEAPKKTTTRKRTTKKTTE